MSAAYDKELLIVRLNAVCESVDRVIRDSQDNHETTSTLNALKAECCRTIGRLANEV